MKIYKSEIRDGLSNLLSEKSSVACCAVAETYNPEAYHAETYFQHHSTFWEHSAEARLRMRLRMRPASSLLHLLLLLLEAEEEEEEDLSLIL